MSAKQLLVLCVKSELGFACNVCKAGLMVSKACASLSITFLPLLAREITVAPPLVDSGALKILFVVTRKKGGGKRASLELEEMRVDAFV